MIGALRPAAQALDHLDAVHVGQAEVEHDHVRAGRARPRSRARRPSAARVDVVAAGAQVDAERPPQAALVVDDQDAGQLSASAPARQPDPHRQPAARGRVGDHRAVHRLDEAARDREPEAEALPPLIVGAAGRARTAVSRCSSGTPGPWSMISSLALSAPA